MLKDGQYLIRPVRFEYAAGHSTGEHQHDEHQLVFAAYGLLCVDTHDARWVVPPFRAVWVPAGVAHTVSARVASEMSTLYVSASVIRPALAAVTVISVSPLLRELIRHAMSDDDDGDRRRRLDAVLLDQLDTAPADPLELRQLVDPRLRAIEAIFEVDPTDQRTLAELGASAGASERTLQRLFHQEIDTTFGRWRTQLRLQHAIILLGQGISVTGTAIGSGYSEPSAFIAAFREAFGTTPGKYFSVSPEAQT